MFIETGVKGRQPFRRYFSARPDALRDLNKYRKYRDIYHTVYWFTDVEKKYNHRGKFAKMGPDYCTALIDKIVFDLDAYKTEKTTEIDYYSPEALESIRLLNDWAKEKNIRRELRFSGGGFHFIISAIGYPLKLKDATVEILNEVGVESDPSVIGDTAQLLRVRNSFNFGDHRKCFCIPLKEEEIYLSYDKIKKLAKTPRFGKRYIYGNDVHNFNHCKIDNSKIKLKELIIKLQENPNADKILSKYGWEISDFCDTIQYILSLKHKGNYLRYELIKYLRSIVLMNFDDCVNVIVALLGQEGIHSAIETQAKHVYGKRRVFHPYKLKLLGYCKNECEECLELRKIL